MRILTLNNRSYDLDVLPEEVDDMHFAVLDNSHPADPDYHYIPLIFLESFNEDRGDSDQDAGGLAGLDR